MNRLVKHKKVALMGSFSVEEELYQCETSILYSLDAAKRVGNPGLIQRVNNQLCVATYYVIVAYFNDDKMVINSASWFQLWIIKVKETDKLLKSIKERKHNKTIKLVTKQQVKKVDHQKTQSWLLVSSVWCSLEVVGMLECFFSLTITSGLDLDNRCWI